MIYSRCERRAVIVYLSLCVDVWSAPEARRALMGAYLTLQVEGGGGGGRGCTYNCVWFLFFLKLLFSLVTCKLACGQFSLQTNSTVVSRNIF